MPNEIRFTQREVDEMIEKAVDRALQRNWQIMGININDVESVEAHRKDWAHSRKMRLASEEAGKAIRQTIYKGIPAIGLIVFTWMVWVFGEGLREVIAEWIKPNA